MIMSVRVSYIPFSAGSTKSRFCVCGVHEIADVEFDLSERFFFVSYGIYSFDSFFVSYGIYTYDSFFVSFVIYSYDT